MKMLNTNILPITDMGEKKQALLSLLFYWCYIGGPFKTETLP